MVHLGMGEKVIGLSELLDETRVLFFPSEAEKGRIFRDLVAALDLPDRAAALEALLRREQWGSTVVAQDLALPHARIPGIRRIAAALGVRPGTHPWIYVLFFGPADDPKQNLDFLAGVSALFQTPGLARSLAGLKNPQTVLAELRQAEAALP